MPTKSGVAATRDIILARPNTQTYLLKDASEEALLERQSAHCAESHG
jgi:hypothetical protein